MRLPDSSPQDTSCGLRLRTLAEGLMLLSAVACAPQPPGARVNAGSRPASYVPAKRPAADCAAERARTASWTLADTVGLRRPLLRLLVMQPLPAPPSVSRFTVEVRVSAAGDVIPDSIWIEGISDRGYEAKVRKAVQGYKYWPAVLNECAVSARTSSGFARSPGR